MIALTDAELLVKTAKKDCRDAIAGESRRCEAIVEIAVASYMAALMHRLDEKGGPLGADDLASVARTLIGSSAHASPLAETAYGALKAAIRKTSHEAHRVDPFGRLIIHTFSHLLVKRGEWDGTGISRAHLPRFFELLRVMLGEETIAARRLLCERVVDDLKVKHPTDFDWKVFYADPRAREVLLRTILDLIEHFRNFDRRVEWFIRFMNSRPARSVRMPIKERPDPFTRSDFFAVTRSMIAYMENELDGIGPVGTGSAVRDFSARLCAVPVA